MLQYLTKVDLFGAEEKLQIHSQNPKQKSGFGGIMTIILYGISIAYFLSELIDWAQNNKLPKITTIKSSIEAGETIQLSGRFLELESNINIDPFNPENMILIPEVSVCLEQNQNFIFKCNMINPKISFMNLQNEVSRLQFLLTKQLGITCIQNCVNTENKIENFLDQFDYRIKLNQPESIINISQGQTDKNVQAEVQDPENLEIQYLESTIGLFSYQPELQQIMKEKEEKTEKEIDLSIIPKECLKQEDLSGLNSPH